MAIRCLWRGDGHRREDPREILTLRLGPRRTIRLSLPKMRPLDHRSGINTRSQSFPSPSRGLVKKSGMS